MNWNDFDNHREEYIALVQADLKVTPRYVVAVLPSVGDALRADCSTVDQAFAFMSKPVHTEDGPDGLPLGVSARYQIGDRLRTPDQGSLHLWPTFAAVDMRNWMSEQTLEEAARALYRKKCREYDLGQEQK